MTLDAYLYPAKGNKFYIYDREGKLTRIKNGTLTVSGNGRIRAKKVTEDFNLSFTDKETGKRVTMYVNIVDPGIEGGNKHKAVINPGSFDFSTNIPLNAVFGVAKNEGVAEGLVYQGIEAIGDDGKLHIRGTAVKKGRILIPFKVNGTKFKLIIKVKK